MGKWMAIAAVIAGSPSPSLGQVAGSAPVEVPLRVVEGRLMVTVDGPDGAQYDFVLGLGMTFITETAVASIGDGFFSLTLGGVPVDMEQAITVPDAQLAGDESRPAGLLGGETLNNFDVLIDAPNERLILKPIGRSVRWEGVSLSNPVALTLFHGVLARVDVDVDGKVFGGLLDLASPDLEINQPVKAATNLSGDRVGSFRMGYSGWSDLRVRVTESSIFQGWDPQGDGFVIVGASVAYDCALAISWAHSELRTCIR